MVRKGLTTRITGSCNIYNSSSTSGSGDYISGPVIEEGTIEQNTVVVNTSATDSTDGNTITIVTEVKDNTIYQFDTPVGHVDTNDKLKERVPAPDKDTHFGINLAGNDVKVSMTTNGAGNKDKETALFTTLGDGVFLTIFNKDETKTGSFTNTFVEIDNTLAGSTPTKDRRLQTTIEVHGPQITNTTNSPTLNIIGVGSVKENGLSNGSVVFAGPLATDCSTKQSISDYETKQGSINLSGSGGNITLDGSVILKGFVGISSWETSLTKTGSITPSLSEEIHTRITLLGGSSIQVTGDIVKGSEKLSDDAQGIAIYGSVNNAYLGGEINITLDNRSFITTNMVTDTSQLSTSTPETGILIDGFSGTLNIELKGGSYISSETGYGITLRNCTGTTVNINYDGTSYIYGQKGAVSATNCPNLKINNNPTSGTTDPTLGTKSSGN